MATAHAPAREPGSPRGSVPLDRFQSIVRARRMKPAARSEHRTERELIHADQYPQHRFHPRDHSSNRITSSRSARLSPRGGGAACTWTTISRAGSGGEMRRKVSRTTRLIRLHRRGHQPSRDNHPDPAAAHCVRRRREGEPHAPLPEPGTQGKLELLWSAQPGGRGETLVRPRHTARRLRPLARRAFSTFLPPRVFMRARKPCVRARRILDG